MVGLGAVLIGAAGLQILSDATVPATSGAGGLREPAATEVVAHARSLARQAGPAAHLPRFSLSHVFPDLADAPADWRGWQPEQITVAPHAGLRLTFTREQAQQTERTMTWVGRIPELPGASLVGIASERAWDAILVVPGAGEFAFHVENGRVSVTESAPGEERCANDEEKAVTAAMTAEYSAPAAGRYVPRMTPGVAEVLAAATDGPWMVDVLLLYDATAVTVARTLATDVEAYMEARGRGMIETANVFFRNSGVENFVWRFAGAAQVPAFARDGKFLTDLNAMTPGGALYSWIRDARYRYGADQMMLLTGEAEAPGGRAATRYQDGSHRDQANEADWAVAVMNVRAGSFTFTHELAHNWGCYHDRGNFFGTNLPTPDSDGYWCYGLRFVDNLGGVTGTIMAYADYKLPYFSNPDLTVRVTSTMQGRAGAEIDVGTFALGYTETHPKAANNARVLRDHAAWMAGLADEIAAAPEIVEQPVATSVEAGQTLALRVAARGGGLYYQWKRNGVAVAGGTTANFSKTAATADAGDYTVEVSNRRGAIVSSVAAVNVTAASAPAPSTPATPSPPPASSGGGGGGGGGATSVCFAGLVAVALLVRRRFSD
ncbi:MAG: hypothetical protein C0518_03065 [Opitutus sp.]|nr:hypothetical protein [Opitutus sp.]